MEIVQQCMQLLCSCGTCLLLLLSAICKGIGILFTSLGTILSNWLDSSSSPSPVNEDYHCKGCTCGNTETPHLENNHTYLKAQEEQKASEFVDDYSIQFQYGKFNVFEDESDSSTERPDREYRFSVELSDLKEEQYVLSGVNDFEKVGDLQYLKEQENVLEETYKHKHKELEIERQEIENERKRCAKVLQNQRILLNDPNGLKISDHENTSL